MTEKIPQTFKYPLFFFPAPFCTSFTHFKMEAFLSTLPPYVHDFIGKHPPTDVFNILRELVCFAVLYSDDRNHINSSAHALLKKKQDREVSNSISLYCKKFYIYIIC
jgi:hypothetical protein